jgi:hypothetical protein
MPARQPFGLIFGIKQLLEIEAALLPILSTWSKAEV